MAALNDAAFGVAFAAAQGRPVCCLDPGAGRAFLERASPWAMGADYPAGTPYGTRCAGRAGQAPACAARRPGVYSLLC